MFNLKPKSDIGLFTDLIKELYGFNEKEETEQEKPETKELEHKIKDLEGKYNKLINLVRIWKKENEEKIKKLSKRLREQKIETKEVIIKSEDVYTSRMELKETESVSDSLQFLKTDGKGNINQILIESPSTDFKIAINIDNYMHFDKAYSYFSDYSTELENVSAYTAGGKYYLSIRNLLFQRGFNIKIAVGSTIIFDQIMCKYYIRETEAEKWAKD